MSTQRRHVCRCHVCTAVIPITFEHQHHVVPRAAGGHEGPTVQLCSGCHASIHRLADMMCGGRAGMAEDAAQMAWPDPTVRDRAFGLAKTVTEYMVMKRDGVIETDHPVRITIALQPKLKLAAQMIANEHRGAAGRRLGLSAWIEALVKREVYRAYPDLDPSR